MPCHSIPRSTLSKNGATQISRIYRLDISTLLCYTVFGYNKFFCSVSNAGHCVCHVVHHTQQFWTEYKTYLSTFFLLSTADVITLVTLVHISSVLLYHRLNYYQPKSFQLCQFNKNSLSFNPVFIYNVIASSHNLKTSLKDSNVVLQQPGNSIATGSAKS